jgi:enoyl-[acyl-carrier protein] reductase / trans-2-enoyl-CoA reductase (NAD+)
MIIQPKFRGFICTTAHPVGCFYQVQEQINYIKSKPSFNGPKKVLVIGASTGYGLASRITATFGAGADSIGVLFEKPSTGNRTATAGWYNTAAFERIATEAGYKAFSINGDAFSKEIKEETIELIRKEFGQVDCVIYSLASPKRVHPATGEVFSSVIKPIGQSYSNKSVDFHTKKVFELTIEPATEEEIRHTVAVMGGEDWGLWIDALETAGVLAEGVITVAYSYIGPKMTHPIYRDGTIGRAKDHLEETAHVLSRRLANKMGRAFISINKALVTQSSSAIPVVPLYISILFKVMKEEGIHEGCIDQMYRLFAQKLYSGHKVGTGRIRLDDLEMREYVQEQITSLWRAVNSENIVDLTDIEGYRKDFFKLFGFDVEGIDYEEDIDPDVGVLSISHA